MNKELIPQTSIMQKEFIPYEQAVDLESIGFDIRPDFGNQTSLYNKEGIRIMYINYGVMGSGLDEGYIYAPTFSQAFRWFREKYGLYHTIWPEFYKDGINFNWKILFWYLPKDEWTKYVISDRTMEYEDNGEYPIQEEAELACLNKLIEIVKNK